MIIPPEDNAEDVINKALRGYGLLEAPSTQEPTYTTFIRDQLHLNPEALASLNQYRPRIEPPVQIQQHGYPFYSGLVNIWSLRLPHGFLLIDTGSKPEEMQRLVSSISEHYPHLQHPFLGILLTHHHFDHAGGLSAYHSIPLFTQAQQTEELNTLSGLDWHILPIPGHSTDSVLFFTHLGDSPILFTGDALFAGSAGRVEIPSQHADMTARLKSCLKNFPRTTLIFPGHGPATNLDLEWRHNPFLA